LAAEHAEEDEEDHYKEDEDNKCVAFANIGFALALVVEENDAFAHFYIAVFFCSVDVVSTICQGLPFFVKYRFSFGGVEAFLLNGDPSLIALVTLLKDLRGHRRCKLAPLMECMGGGFFLNGIEGARRCS